MKLEAL